LLFKIWLRLDEIIFAMLIRRFGAANVTSRQLIKYLKILENTYIYIVGVSCQV